MKQRKTEVFNITITSKALGETYSWGSDYKTLCYKITSKITQEVNMKQWSAVVLVVFTFSIASETGSGKGPLFPMQVIQP